MVLTAGTNSLCYPTVSYFLLVYIPESQCAIETCCASAEEVMWLSS